MGSTSRNMEALFGDVRRHVRFLTSVAEKLQRTYRDSALQPIFESLPSRSISIAPMVLCESLAADLRTAVPDDLLCGIGTLCLHIGTHDDLVDELPQNRRTIAALAYAGNIAALEGTQLLSSCTSPAVLRVVLGQIAQNHLMQQRCVALLWEGHPRTFAEYREGLEHDCVFASIGIFAALALAQQTRLREQLWKFCIGYGVSFQLLDDIAEVEEDKAFGYHSFPLLEGPPFTESFRQIFAHLDDAEAALAPAWTTTRALLSHPRAFAENTQHALLRT